MTSNSGRQSRICCGVCRDRPSRRRQDPCRNRILHPGNGRQDISRLSSHDATRLEGLFNLRYTHTTP
jgi:hypothetical protein